MYSILWQKLPKYQICIKMSLLNSTAYIRIIHFLSRSESTLKSNEMAQISAKKKTRLELDFAYKFDMVSILLNINFFCFSLVALLWYSLFGSFAP